MEEVIASNLQFSAFHLWFSHHVRRKVSRKVTFNVKLKGTIKGKINFMTSFKWLRSFRKIFSEKTELFRVFLHFSYIFIVFLVISTQIFVYMITFSNKLISCNFSVIWVFLENAIAKYYLLRLFLKIYAKESRYRSIKMIWYILSDSIIPRVTELQLTSAHFKGCYRVFESWAVTTKLIS